MGFSSNETDTANDYVFGYNMIEGAPGLKEAHLAVFDCANVCGRIGQRSIDWKAHVMMMAAAQPFHIRCYIKNNKYAIRLNCRGNTRCIQFESRNNE